MARALVMMVAALALTVMACGEDGSGSSGSSDTPRVATSGQGEASAPDPGCYSDRPWRVRGAAIPASLVTCASDDGTSVHLRNTSSMVFAVQPAGSGQPSLAVEPATGTSFVDRMVAAAHPTWCVAGQELCFVGPNAALVAEDDVPVALRAEVDARLTGAVTAAAGFASWAEGKLGSRAQELRSSVEDCATSVRQLEPSPQGVATAIQSDLSHGGACLGLAMEVYDWSGEAAPAEVPASTVLRGAGRYAANGERDLTVARIARIAARLHR